MTGFLKALICIFTIQASLTAFADKAAVKQDNFYLYGQQFTLIRPANVSSDENLPLLVLIHGCRINASDILKMSALSELAVQKKFMILAPDQSRLFNIDNCWNWFSADNQIPNAFTSELKTIKAGVDWIHSRYSSNKDRTYVAGFSSGAAMASNLFYCYSETFAGAAIHSGAAFKSALGVVEAEQTLLKGSKKTAKQLALSAHECAAPRLETLKAKKLIVVHGDKDTRVHIKNATQVIQQFIGFMDLVDDGKWNRSLNVSEKSSAVNNKSFPATVTTYNIGGIASVDIVKVENLAHFWSGGAAHDYSEPKSFSASKFIVQKLITEKP